MDKQMIANIRQWLEDIEWCNNAADVLGVSYWQSEEFAEHYNRYTAHQEFSVQEWVRELLAEHDANETRKQRASDVFGTPLADDATG